MTHTQDQLKHSVAKKAIEFIRTKLQTHSLLVIGTGSTVDIFIDLLAPYKEDFKGAVSSSERSTQRLRSHGIKVYELNQVDKLKWYVDGADEINLKREMIKGGGGALTREKI